MRMIMYFVRSRFRLLEGSKKSSEATEYSILQPFGRSGAADGAAMAPAAAADASAEKTRVRIVREMFIIPPCRNGSGNSTMSGAGVTAMLSDM